MLGDADLDRSPCESVGDHGVRGVAAAISSFPAGLGFVAPGGLLRRTRLSGPEARAFQGHSRGFASTYSRPDLMPNMCGGSAITTRISPKQFTFV